MSQTEHCLAYPGKGVTIFFDLQGRYVRACASSERHSGLTFGIQWKGGGAVIKEGESGHPIWDISPEKVPLLRQKDVKVTQLPKACKLSKDGTPVAYAPNSINDSLAFFLRDRPLSTMGHALALASAGPKARAVHASFIAKAFSTVDHPFRAIENSELEEVIRLAYSGVSTMKTFCNGFFQKNNGHILVQYVGIAKYRYGYACILSKAIDNEKHQRAWANLLDMQKDALPSNKMIARNILRFVLDCVKQAKPRKPLTVVIRSPEKR